MSQKSKWKYLRAIYPRYRKVSKDLRCHTLDEFCQVCGDLEICHPAAPWRCPGLSERPGEGAASVAYFAEIVERLFVMRP